MFEAIVNFLAGDGGLWALGVSAFLSATLLPGSSEALLTASLAADPTTIHAVNLVVVASLFNTLGSMTSWVIGRYFPHKTPDSLTLERLRRWGAPGLALAWVPVVGDLLPLAAGWLGIGFWPALFWTFVGKTGRYVVWAAVVMQVV